eukprot:TRINITY_DN63746_c0_g1_i1.p1 TRINITY_DN63746_c0_g1~~TRINITY_DN63746_c0_g1_i1.p1  ORF type:complete len:244 (+),score=57.29 TRINITY_DN63746_c0_g1_i1:74-805(+)
MAASEDYYSLLGVDRSASADDIKKAYRKAALRWHPDKNSDNKEVAEAMFKEVAEAYEVLSDPNKRSLYDRGGKEALSGGGGSGGRGSGAQFHGFHGSDPFSVFNQFFGGRDPFAEMDMMFSNMHGRGSQTRQMGQMGGFFANDDFFSSGFGNMGGGGGGSGVVSSSTSTTTRIVNGKRVSVTEKTVRKADGTTETTRTESSSDAGGGGQSFGFGGMLEGDFFGGGRSRMNSGNRRSLFDGPSF